MAQQARDALAIIKDMGAEPQATAPLLDRPTCRSDRAESRFACAEDQIADINSDLTIVGGKIVFGAGDFAPFDEAAPPPAMPDWSPVRIFGGYAAWGTMQRPGRRRSTRSWRR